MKMNTNLINAIETFAKLNIATLTTDSAKTDYIESVAMALGVTENRFIEIIKNEISFIKTQDCYFQKSFENAIYRATLECALFNARRCYHARLALAA
jgi:hypothetical protein